MLRTIAYLILICFLFHPPAFAQMVSNSQEYKSCTSQARSDPSKALIMADEWARTSNAASAYHCRAIALFALKRYNDAGLALDQLADRISSNNLLLWANVLRQSSRAWNLGGERAKALISITKAIQPTSEEAYRNPTMARLASELLMERSDLYAASGRNLFAVQDLDQAAALYPEDEKILLARAKLFIEMNEQGLAEKDLQYVMAKQPNNAVAQRLIDAIKAKKKP